MSVMSDDAATGTVARVLIVEDEFLIRLTLAEVLADEGYEVLEAETAEEAMAHLGQGRVDILLTDIQLPGATDGRALARQARSARPGLPVVFMTGRPDPADAAAAGGPTLAVAKPYLPSEICTAVRRLLAGAAAPG